MRCISFSLILLFLRFLALCRAVTFNSYGPPENGLDWIDNSLVPEPTDGLSRWWYAPSRKAHLHENRKQMLMESLKANRDAASSEDLRLPRDVKPTIYSLQLLPFVEEGNFTTHGFVSIDIDCKVSTRNITLHSKSITIDRSSIKVYFSR